MKGAKHIYDVVELVEQWARNANVADWRSNAKQHQNQCVYILECRGVYKIGKTGDLNGRMKGLQVGNPFEMRIVHIIFTEHNTKVEQALHCIFADSRAQNEWFNLGLRDVATIKSMTVEQILSAAEALKPKPETPTQINPDQMSFDW